MDTEPTQQAPPNDEASEPVRGSKQITLTLNKNVLAWVALGCISLVLVVAGVSGSAGGSDGGSGGGEASTSETVSEAYQLGYDVGYDGQVEGGEDGACDAYVAKQAMSGNASDSDIEDFIDGCHTGYRDEFDDRINGY